MTYTDLPHELESEILSRVPVTSLSKLRFVCKRWYALFKDPIFIKKNSCKAANQVILKKDDKVYSVTINPYHGFHNDSSFEFTGTLKCLKHSEHVMISNIFHCDGLLSCFTKDNRLAVWNPCTGQTRWIQAKLFRRGYTRYQNYFLGKSRDSYKILSFNCYYIEPQGLEVAESEIEERLEVLESEIMEEGLEDLEPEIEERALEVTEFEVYEFSSDSWRVLDGITGELGSLSHGVSLKGNTYWFESDREVYGEVDGEVNFLPNAILKFDFTTESFERLSLPFQSDVYDEIVILSVVKEEKLALLRQQDDFKIKIMVSNTMTDEAKDLSWNDFLVVDFAKLEINYMSNEMSFLVDEENKMVVCCDTEKDELEYTIEIFGDQEMHKQVYRETTKGSKRYKPLLLSYVPSLVQI